MSRRVLGLGRAQQPPLHAACPLPAVGRQTEGHELGPGTEGWGVGVLGCCRRAGAPTWRPGTHTLRGSIPGADDGREEPRPGGGEAGSKPFTALWGWPEQRREGKRKRDCHLTSLDTQRNSFALYNYSSSRPRAESWWPKGASCLESMSWWEACEARGPAGDDTTAPSSAAVPHWPRQPQPWSISQQSRLNVYQ